MTTRKIAELGMVGSLVLTGAACANGENGPTPSISRDIDSEKPQPKFKRIPVEGTAFPPGINHIEFYHAKTGRKEGRLGTIVCFDKDVNPLDFVRIMSNDNNRDPRGWRSSETFQIAAVLPNPDDRHCTRRLSEIKTKANENIIFYYGKGASPDESAKNVTAYDIRTRNNIARGEALGPAGTVPPVVETTGPD